MSRIAKKVADLTEADREALRVEWAEAETRVRGKPTKLPFSKVERRVAVRPKFDKEDCQGCGRLLSRGTLWPVPGETDRAVDYRFLCSECRKKSA